MTTFTPSDPPLRRALHAAILLALLAPALVAAQDDFSLDEPVAPAIDADAIAELTQIRSFIEFGIGYIDDDSFRFGRYTGMHREGGYGVLNIDWFRRGAWNSPDAGYTRITATDVGLSSRRASLEHGVQGNYRLRVDYAQMPSYRSDSATTIFNGAGSVALTLPGDWVPAQNTAGMTNLTSSLRPFEIRQERRRSGLGLDKLLSERWSITSDVRTESKQGVRTFGAVIGNSGGNPRAVLLPEPIDYETREADVALRYTDARKQFEFRYLVSLFDDGNSALSWQNPYATINGWDASAGYPTGFGQAALPPDNQFHQASFASGFTWANGLRLTADAALGRMTQDEPFLPYTINPTLAAGIVQPLPRASLDGRIDTTVVNVRLGSRPSTNFHWNASLRYDDRDNQTPRDEYNYIGGDSSAQTLAETSNRRRFNEPYSFRETRLKIDAGYRFGSRTLLTGALEQRDTERTYTEREEADETIASLALRHSASEWFSGSLRASRADRSGSTYHGNEPFLSGYAPGYTSTVPGQFENPPGLRKFYLADRIRDRVGGNLTLMPNEQWSIGFDAQRVEDDYDASELGLTRSDSDMFTIDIAFVPNAEWSAWLFHSRENLAFDQDGRSISGGSRLVDAGNPDRNWTALHDESVDTSGIGFNWKVIERRLEVGLDHLYASTRSDIEVSTGPALTPAAALPTDRTRLQSTSVFGKYRLRDNLSLHMRLWHERYRSTDFAVDGIGPNQLANVILLGEDSPDYSINAVTFSLVYRFD